MALHLMEWRECSLVRRVEVLGGRGLQCDQVSRTKETGRQCGPVDRTRELGGRVTQCIGRGNWEAVSADSDPQIRRPKKCMSHLTLTEKNIIIGSWNRINYL